MGSLIDRTRLADQLRALGIAPGGIVLVHCSLRRVGPVQGGPVTLLEAIADVLGEGGTIVVPSQTPGNSLTSRAFRTATQGLSESERDRYRAAMPGFDPRSTPSQGMGAFAEAVRLHPAARRSAHPQTSFAAVGAAAERVAGVHDLDCHLGERSPLGTLYRLGATILMIGVGMEKCTALHLGEYRLSGPPPIMTFSCFVIENGRRRLREFDAPGLDDSDFPVVGDDLLAQPWACRGRLGSTSVDALPLIAAVDHATMWFEKNRGRQ
jgi:aminoglycoside 3-N-acetyltransferase